ncbi:hypothetical protein [Streptomyces olivochromogenes]|uniref:hypothetical protein n=1 Tax=Streptomyces olivochromogenes TaxID=1963 RepID=UPI001F37FE05|nr:hypothetical protein [Streptomyces olivochromogenes]MCF3135071.1 hypothetical protein [Streptomyces olivochromogenes]
MLEADRDYAVSDAASGPAAVTETARGIRPDLVLLDLGLPGKDVLAVIQELNALEADVVTVPHSVARVPQLRFHGARHPAEQVGHGRGDISR